jgi:hypothetical protein
MLLALSLFDAVEVCAVSGVLGAIPIITCEYFCECSFNFPSGSIERSHPQSTSYAGEGSRDN